jgi:hypothetical protein
MDEQQGQQNSNDNGGEVSPINLSDLKLRLIHGDSGKADPFSKLEVFKEVKKLGVDAMPLLPTIVAEYRVGRLKPGTWELVELYQETNYAPLLEALREKRAFDMCSVDEKCLLLEAGLADCEQELRDWLYQNWNKRQMESWERTKVVQALGKAGGSESREVVEVVNFRLAGIVQEQRAGLGETADEESEHENIFIPPPGVTDPDGILNILRGRAGRIMPKFEYQYNKKFLAATRDAIQQFNARGRNRPAI